MKKLRKVIVFLLMIVVCINVNPIIAFGNTVSQDGLEVVLTTNKENYEINEPIEVTVTIKNTNNYEVLNISIENILPDGYELYEDETSVKQIDVLESGETIDLVTKFVPKRTDEDKPSKGNDEGNKSENNGDGKVKATVNANSSNSKPNDTYTSSNVSANSTGSNNNSANNTGSGNSNTTNSKGITAAKTGDNSNIIFWAILMIVSIVILLLSKNKNLVKKALSIFLCFIIVSSSIIYPTIEVHAATSRNISVSQTVSVESSQLTLSAKIAYKIDDELQDTDGDGLVDYDEEDIKTNAAKTDTDGDGLNDYQEIILGTDPLTQNEYDDSLDSDSDGLTDIEEVKNYETDPYSIDTDSDGLSDYDEVKNYDTNPTKPDTDEDSLSDGFELEHGLDPKNAYTDGKVYDGNVTISQTLSGEGISQVLKEDTNSAKPCVSGSTAGELSKNVFLSSSSDSSFDELRSVIGEAVYVDGADEYLNGLTLTFDLSSYVGNLEELIIVSDNDGDFDIIESSLNGNEISCILENSGTYCVLDLNEFLTSLGFELTPYWDGTINSDDYVNAISVEDNGNEISNEIMYGNSCADTILVNKSNQIESTVKENEDNEDRNIFVERTSELEEPLSSDSSINEVTITDENVAEESLYDSVSSDEELVDLEDSENNEGLTDDSVSESFSAEVDIDLLEELNDINEELVSATVSGQADIVFAIDTTGSMSSTINNVVTNVTSFATSLAHNYNVNVNYALIDFRDLEEDGPGTTKIVKNGSSNWFTNVNTFVDKVSDLVADGGGDSPECSIDAVETARRLDFRASASKYIILITDETYKTKNDYGISTITEEAELLKNDGIITSVVSRTNLQDTYKSLYALTGGIFANINSSSFSSSLLSLAALIGETTTDGTWAILKHGYRYVKLLDEKDQDKDGISTVNELGEAKEIDLTPFVAAELLLHGVPFEKYYGKTSVLVYNAKSDPTKSDTDNDGISDKKDTAPWSRGLKDGIVGAIKVCSYGGGVGSSAGISGHAYIAYTSFVRTPITLYGIKVNSEAEVAKQGDTRTDTPTDHLFVMDSDSVISVGGWAGWLPDKLKGSWINNEFYLFTDGVKADQRSLMKYITYSQMERMESSVKNHSKWTYLYNCSAFATDVWNDTVSDNLSAKGPWASPKTLSYNIQKRDGYKIADPMHANWP